LNYSIVLSFIGDDKPGLIEQLASTVSEHQGNWLESRMEHLAGKFVGIARLDCTGENAEALCQALNAQSGQHLLINAELSQQDSEAKAAELRISILGPDRPGIIREISQALAQRNINVSELHSDVTSAPMSGEALFDARADIQIPDNCDVDDLRDRLDDIANDLTLDISLQEISD
jgi:glycine cleavage system regulatory protein